MPPTALGDLLTWSCYGTWLHGDIRGSVDDQHNICGHPVVTPDAPRETAESKLLHGEPKPLSNASRRIILRAIIEHCPFRGVQLRAASVRTNHVHAVVTTGPMDPGKLVGSLKAWSTRRLREAGLVKPDEPVWTKRSSTRYLWTVDDMEAAIEYVARRQGPRDEFTIRGRDLPCPTPGTFGPPTTVGGSDQSPLRQQGDSDPNTPSSP